MFKVFIFSFLFNLCVVKCKFGICVSLIKVCDFVNDCGLGDNSDE